VAYYTGSASSLSNIPTIVSGQSVGTSISSTGTASFANGTLLATVGSGGTTVAVGDTFTIGSHTITFDANGTNTAGYDSTHVDIGTGGTINSTSITNLAAYLNHYAGTTGFSDIAGITFTGSGSSLYAINTAGGSTIPQLSTSYNVASPFVF